jgi:hypothetical protein
VDAGLPAEALEILLTACLLLVTAVAAACDDDDNGDLESEVQGAARPSAAR